MNVLFCSCVILINKQNRVLISQRPHGKFMDGFWEFPGGKVKNLEKFNDAAVRELKEELGVTLDTKNLTFLMNIFYKYPEYYLSMQVYFVDKWKGNVKSLEKQKFNWVKKETLKE